MIFDKLFGKKKEEEVPINDLNKIKKVVYHPAPEKNQNNLNLNNLSNSTNSMANLNSNLANNNTLGLNNVTSNSLIQQSNPSSQQPQQLNINEISNPLSNPNNSVQQLTQQNQQQNQQIQQVLPQQNVEEPKLPKPTQMAVENSHKELNLSDLSIEEELKKLNLENEVKEPLNAQAVPQITHEENNLTLPQNLKQNNLEQQGVVLNVVEKKEEGITLDREKLKEYSKREVEKEETEEEDVLFIRLDKYEETLKLIEDIRKKIDENEAILEKIVELKKEEDVKLERWSNELNKINRNLLKIYTTLKKVK